MTEHTAVASYVHFERFDHFGAFSRRQLLGLLSCLFRILSLGSKYGYPILETVLHPKPAEIDLLTLCHYVSEDPVLWTQGSYMTAHFVDVQLGR